MDEETKIIIAHLRAEIIIQQEKAIALRKWSLNLDHQLKANVCDELIKGLRLRINNLYNTRS
jgi:hypothetical protein